MSKTITASLLLVIAAAAFVSSATLPSPSNATDANCTILSEGKNYSTMFVQTGYGAKLALKQKTYTLTVSKASPNTLWFNDRPSRVGGSDPNAVFLAGMPMTQSDPVNAALVVSDPLAVSRQSVVLVELYDGVYSSHAHTLTYKIKLLPRATPLKFFTASADDVIINVTKAMLEAHGGLTMKGDVSLFIDDCETRGYECNDGTGLFGADTFGCLYGVPMCYQHGRCQSCRSVAPPCIAAFGPSASDAYASLEFCGGQPHATCGENGISC